MSLYSIEKLSKMSKNHGHKKGGKTVLRKRYKAIIDLKVAVDDFVKGVKDPYVINKIKKIVRAIYKDDFLLLKYYEQLFYELAEENLFNNDCVISKGVQKNLNRRIFEEDKIFRIMANNLSNDRDTLRFIEEIRLLSPLTEYDEKIYNIIRNQLGLFSITKFRFREI